MHACHGSEGKQGGQEIAECSDGDIHDAEEDKKSSIEADKQKDMQEYA